ncbi:fimbrial protein [Stenotrophomonas maltophilia]|uniref:fimbrial protein n=1 Tax=Stenotrophomonas maltophilia TaxID=40324 RepID=UPI0013131676|nr:fimbrial protein [Stenotrophomonas maltophilia]
MKPSSSAHRLRAVLVLCALLLPAAAQASCTRLNPGDQHLVLSFPMPNIDRPDTGFGPLGGNGNISESFECSAGQTAFDVDLSFPGLTYERDIVHNGHTYPAYSFGPRSPLIGFYHNLQTPTGEGSVGLPVALGRNRNPGIMLATTRPVTADLLIVLFARGGAMQGMPDTDMGFATSSVEGDPGQNMRHYLQLGLPMRPVTCTVSDTPVSLDPAAFAALATPGDSTEETPFEVPLNCPSANVDVFLRVDDASGTNAADGVLAPTAASSASGVRMQLLMAGAPLALGREWNHGYSSAGVQPLPFVARYLRTSDALVPGDIGGEAVLTADYR